MKKRTSKIAEFNLFSPSDQKVYISDIGKITKVLNWKPQVSPKEGMKKLINWVKENKTIF